MFKTEINSDAVHLK